MATIRTAAIVAVGSELLTPFRSDTNSLAITARLNDLGIDVRGKAVVADAVADITAAVRRFLSEVDLVVLSGGLGPTDDDLTREGVSAALGRPLAIDPTILAAIEQRFATRGWPMPANNRRQAMVPQGGVALRNPNGTAPGLWIEDGARVVVLLPGPPRELNAIVDHEVLPRLEARVAGRRVLRRVIRTTGRPESAVDEVASPIYTPLRVGAGVADGVSIETSILASGGQIELHLGAVTEGTEAAAAALERAVGAMQTALIGAFGSIVISTDGRSLEQVIGDELLARGWHLAAAESCTGGMLMTRLTEIPGSSAWFRGGVVAYENAVKRECLGVPADMLERYGAVSEPVAVAMADGARERLGAEIGVGITGIAGPTGGTPEKPVGTVVMAVSGPTAVVRTAQLLGDRHMIRTFATQQALDMVRRLLVGS